MGDGGRPRRARLSIEVEPELRRRLKVVAAQKDTSIRDYVVAVLLRALEAEGVEERKSPGQGWSRLSARSFARDWDSDEDAAYDQPA